MTEQPQAATRPAPPISTHTDPISAWLWNSPIAQLMLGFMPLSVLPFLRHSHGHRCLKMWMLVADAVFLLLWGSLGAWGGNLPFSTQRGQGISPVLLLFVGAMLALGWLHGRRGRALALAGELVTVSRGTPWLAKVPALTRLPFVNEDFIARKVEPVVCVAAAVLVWPFSGALGLWLALSGLMLAGWEQLLRDQEEHRFFDVLDGYHASKFAGLAQQMMRQSGKRPEASATGGVRVVFDPKMQRLWEAATRGHRLDGQVEHTGYVAPDLPSSPFVADNAVRAENGAIPMGPQAA